MGHCVAVCERAVSCGVTDQEHCEIGCARAERSICNEASVPARDCAQIAAEAEALARRGRELVTGAEQVFTPAPAGNPSGLCKDNRPCSIPQACRLETNTCGPCENNAQCDRGSVVVEHKCDDSGACVEVECLHDDDCPGQVCDPAANVCRFCLRDEHCEVGACDPVDYRCVDCLEHAHCEATAASCNGVSPCTEQLLCDTSGVFPECVQCLDNADCVPSEPSCQYGECWPCTDDASCALVEGRPYCHGLACVECSTASECPDPERPICRLTDYTCVAGGS